MNIGTRQHLATAAAFAAIGAIAATLFIAKAEVDDAGRQRRQTTDIAQGFTELRLVTFDYLLNRNERARVQWHSISGRIDRLIAANHFRDPEQIAILADLRRREVAAVQIFDEFVSANGGAREGLLPLPSQQRFEAQLISRLINDQQENINDAFRLAGLASQRIDAAQHRVAVVVFGGLLLFALIAGCMSWLIRRDVLVPIIRLKQATHELATGNWNHEVEIGAADEVGDLAGNFNAMASKLREAFAQIDAKNRKLAVLNEDLEAFSCSVSHDLRGPLRAMNGFSQLLIEDHADKLDSGGKDALKHLRAASVQMASLIDDLLRLSQVTHGGINVHFVDLSAMARDIADSLDGEESGRSVTWKIEPGLRVLADPALLRIALQNLLQNAWKYTSRKERPEIRVGKLARDGYSEYFVADNGAGFDMAHARRLFSAFQRLHPAGEFPGTGIGLTIVKRILCRHGGNIRAEARVGEGATFFFSFDAREDRAEAPSPVDGQSTV